MHKYFLNDPQVYKCSLIGLKYLKPPLCSDTMYLYNSYSFVVLLFCVESKPESRQMALVMIR